MRRRSRPSPCRPGSSREPSRTSASGLFAPSVAGEYLLLLDIVTPEAGSLTARGVEAMIVRVTVGETKAPTVAPAAASAAPETAPALTETTPALTETAPAASAAPERLRRQPPGDSTSKPHKAGPDVAPEND